MLKPTGETHQGSSKQAQGNGKGVELRNQIKPFPCWKGGCRCLPLPPSSRPPKESPHVSSLTSESTPKCSLLFSELEKRGAAFWGGGGERLWEKPAIAPRPASTLAGPSGSHAGSGFNDSPRSGGGGGREGGSHLHLARRGGRAQLVAGPLRSLPLPARPSLFCPRSAHTSAAEFSPGRAPTQPGFGMRVPAAATAPARPPPPASSSPSDGVPPVPFYLHRGCGGKGGERRAPAAARLADVRAEGGRAAIPRPAPGPD